MPVTIGMLNNMSHPNTRAPGATPSNDVEVQCRARIIHANAEQISASISSLVLGFLHSKTVRSICPIDLCENITQRHSVQRSSTLTHCVSGIAGITFSSRVGTRLRALAMQLSDPFSYINVGPNSPTNNLQCITCCVVNRELVG